MARIPYVDGTAAHPDVREMFDRMESGGHQLLNLYRMVGHCGKIGPAFIRLGNRILSAGTLSPALRELAILQVGALAAAPYEFSKHTVIGLRCGLSQPQIDAMPDWRSQADLYDAPGQAVLAYTDEVAGGCRATDDVFAALRGHLDDEQVVELTLVVGYYGMVCRVLEALQIELEDEQFRPLGREA